MVMSKSTPAQFIRQVRQEVSRVIWPSRRETAVATVTVFVAAALMSVFFLAVDQAIAWGLGTVLG